MMVKTTQKWMGIAVASALVLAATSAQAEESPEQEPTAASITAQAVAAAEADANDDEPGDEPEEAAEEEAEEAGAAEEAEEADAEEFEEEVEEEVEDEDGDVWGDVDAALQDVDDAEEGAEATIIEKPFAPTFAGGVEVGYFFTDLERFNSYILEDDNESFDVSGTYHVDLVAESRVLENLRVSVLGGVLFAAQSDPSLFGWYVGAEPAYVARDGAWEMALGMGVGLGSMNITAEMPDGNDAEMDSSLVMLRPFLEVRRHMNEHRAFYGRVGFNQWYPRSPESDEFNLDDGPTGRPVGTPELETGNLYVALGSRFGSLSATGEPEEIEVTEEELEEKQEEEEDDNGVDLEEEFED